MEASNAMDTFHAFFEAIGTQYEKSRACVNFTYYSRKIKIRRNPSLSFFLN